MPVPLIPVLLMPIDAMPMWDQTSVRLACCSHQRSSVVVLVLLRPPTAVVHKTWTLTTLALDASRSRSVLWVFDLQEAHEKLKLAQQRFA